MISFLHAADLHLGLRLTRFTPHVATKIREARFQALERIRDVAREQQPAFVLIAGDLFDDHAIDGDIARRAFALLESFTVPIYVLSGNHDPLLPGSVWDRKPWDRANGPRVFVLREPAAVEIMAGLVLLPCPVFRKTSLDDPTRWIAQSSCDRGPLRIGVAHGSLKIREDLPAEDHLISRNAAQDLHLDYLALGHWHSRQLFRSSDGVERTAYAGVHETMRFPGASDGRTGWVPYSGGGRTEFLDQGKGELWHVTLDRPGAPPELRPIEVGHLIWEEERRSLASADDLGQLVNEVATRPHTERRLLRLALEGVVEPSVMLRLKELEDVLDRYLFKELDTSGLRIQPTPEELAQMASQGILRRVFEQLQDESQGPDEHTRRIAQRAMVLLYQLAAEVSA